MNHTTATQLLGNVALKCHNDSVAMDIALKYKFKCYNEVSVIMFQYMLQESNNAEIR